MKFLRCFFAAVILIISGNTIAQNQDELNELMRNRGEYYFTLPVEDVAEIQNLGEICSIDGTDGHVIVAYANQQEYNKLLELGLKPKLQTPPSLRANVTMWNGQGTYNWDSYLTYPQYVAMMEGFPSKAIEGRTCDLFSLGTLTTTNHRQLLGVHIYSGNPEGKPRFLYSSTMHGDEVTGMILMLRLIDELCTSTEERIVNLLNNVDIYILPLTNPDGTYKGGNSTVNSAQRYNGNNVDLNRNYKDYFNGDHPDGNSNYQNETTWTMAFADEKLFTMGANYHGGAEVMNYCWDWVFESHADVDWWEYVCSEYVTLARQINSSYMGGYNYGSNNYDYDGVTNGATWYSITGSRQDYMNGYAQCREVTVECSSTKTVSGSSLPSYWTYHHNCMLTLMEQARNGVHGVVYDAVTGQTLEGVTVSVLNHDIHNTYVTTHSVGDFHRPIKGGTYTFVFDKEGYAREYVEVTVADGQRTDLTVNLIPSNETQKGCYSPVDLASISGGVYYMGSLDGSNLKMPTHTNTNTTNSVSVSTSSYPVTLTDDGFTFNRGSEPLKISLNPSGNAGQYLISYKGRLLSRSGSSLVWAKPSNSSGSGVDLSSYRWTINANGIYMTASSGWSGSTTYYLYYENGSFKASTTKPTNININFYSEGVCPTPEAMQTVNLVSGWNWFVPMVEMTLAELEEALGENGLIIKSQTQTVFYEEGAWEGDNITITPGRMYKIKVQSADTITLTGNNITGNANITINYGSNWFGYTGSEMSIANILSACGFTPAEGDIIKTNSRSTFYEEGIWEGDFVNLTPGQGYIYISRDHNPKQLSF